MKEYLFTYKIENRKEKMIIPAINITIACGDILILAGCKCDDVISVARVVN